MSENSKNQTESGPLLGEFPAPTREEWRSAAEALLKGAPFEKKMRTRTVEGIVLEPIYDRESVEGLPHLGRMPGGPASPRGATASGYLADPWDCLQEITAGDPAEFNRQLLDGLRRGQSGVLLSPDWATTLLCDPSEASRGEVAACGLSLARLEDLKRALDGVLPEAVSIHLKPGCAMVPMAAFLAGWSAEVDADPSRIRGALHSDPIGHWVSAGSLPASYEAMMDQLRLSWDLVSQSLPRFALVGCSGVPFHMAGASAVDELALVLGEAVEYLRQLGSRGLSVAEVAERMVFTFALGSDFFMELAKVRAARIAWARVQEAFGIEEPTPMRIVGRTGFFNKTVFDPYVNLLRTTTEAFCGVLGGVEALTVGTFDECVRESDAFSRRIARNTHTILAEECELARVVDPAGGSWYLESLTDEVVRAAWSRFQEVEAAGGVADAFRSGGVAAMCGHSRAERENRLNQRRFSLIGTNVYANPTEVPMDSRLPDYGTLHGECAARAEPRSDLELHADDPVGLVEAARKGATVGDYRRALLPGAAPSEVTEALPHHRLAEDYEKLRKAAFAYEKENGTAPKLFLANLGPLRKHKLRADFTRGFFGPGGFEVVYPQGFEDPEAAAAAFADSGASVAVVCGADDQYGESFVPFARALKAAVEGATVILAGHPGERETEYREAGMDEFIWIKSDNYSMNHTILRRAGVELSCETR